MSSDHAEERAFYWSLDIPGLTEERALQVASIIRGSGLSLEPLPVNPANFLTLHIDRESAETLMLGLAGIRPNAVSDGLRESIEDWLTWTAEMSNGEGPAAN